MSNYKVYSDFLREKYGEKVYKLPINLNITCPNRDGKIGTGGCIFCGEKGAGFESLSNELSVKEQLLKNKDYIGSRYGAKKFIAFFQNFTNTYLPKDVFKKVLYETVLPDIVETCVSTRPDCIGEDYIKIMKNFSEDSGVNVSLEYGLQTANYKTLDTVNRGHGLAEFIYAVNLAHSCGIPVCAHVIADFPWDDDRDVVETAKILSALKVEGVKLHSLYIVKGTKCCEMYQSGELRLLTPEDYVRRAILFLEHLSPDCAVERIIGRAPEEDTVTANFDTGWWKIKEEIEKRMELGGIVQGDKLKLSVY